MNNEILQLGNLIGYILQSIYFSTFILNTKDIKDKRILFNTLVFGEFIFLKYICNMNYTINFEIAFGVLLYLIIKLVYKQKARITDLTIYILAMIFLGIINVATILLLGVNMYSVIVGNILPIIFVYILRSKLMEIDNFYTRFWNKHNNSKVFKSITIRGFSSILTTITFLLAHLWLIYGALIVRR